jgi:flagellar biosynthesis protein FlhB
MAEDEGEKTEDATPKRQQEAADEGRVARSQEAGIAAAILAAAAGVKMIADDSGIALAQFLQRSLGSAGEVTLDEGTAIMLLRDMIATFAAAAGGLILLVAGSTFFVAAMQSNGQISTKALKLHWERLDPSKNLKRLLAPSQFVETGKALLKVAVVGAIVWKLLAGAIPSTAALSQAGPSAIAPWLADQVGRLLLTIGLAYAAVGGADYFWQRFQFEKSLRMSKEEVKREAKEEQGDPIIRSARRRFAREVAFGQMLKDVKTASVVITNPTHIAVAIQYDDTEAPVPVVVAMGQDKVAERIKAIAAEAGVPLVENVPVARALFKAAKVGSVIPIELYMAVAEILAYVYRTRRQRGNWRGSVRA